jgi:ATP/maltotriose-dependent transcriptional regulator MalT
MMALEAGANVEQHLAGTASALDLVRDSEHPIDRAFGERARRLAKIKYLEILLLSDDVSTRENIPALLKEIGEWNQGPQSGDLWLEERAIVVRAIHLLRSGDPRGTISLLSPVIVRAKASGRVLAASEASLVRIAAESQLDDDDRVSRALLSTIETLVQLGAEGVVAKFQSILKLPLQRLEVVTNGQAQSSRDETASAIRALTSLSGERSIASDVESELLLEVTLTPTETKVLKHAAAGLRNAEIADRTLMSVQTAKWHLHNIFSKMGVKNRTTAILRAKELMLI